MGGGRRWRDDGWDDGVTMGRNNGGTMGGTMGGRRRDNEGPMGGKVTAAQLFCTPDREGRLSSE